MGGAKPKQKQNRISCYTIASALVIAVIAYFLFAYKKPTAKVVKSVDKLVKQKKKHEQPRFSLKAGDSFEIATVETLDVKLRIVDYVTRDETGELVVVRELRVDPRPNIVLSFAKLKKPKDLRNVKTTKNWEVDHHYVWAYYLKHVIAVMFATEILQPSGTKDTERKMLSIGLGGGTINSFVHEKLKNVKIEVVEIDPAVLNIARDYFGYVEDGLQKCIIEDGVEFLKRCNKEGKTFDVIVLDACVNNEVLVQCPVEPFTDSAVISTIAKALKKTGYLFINVLSFGQGAVPTKVIIRNFEAFFGGCIQRNAGGNQVVVCGKTYGTFKKLIGNEIQRKIEKYWNLFGFATMGGFYS